MSHLSRKSIVNKLEEYKKILPLGKECSFRHSVWSAESDPFLPGILVCHPGTIDLREFENEHMLPIGKPDTAKQCRYSIGISQFEGRANRSHKNKVIPKVRFNNKTTISYDLACGRILTDTASHLLIDSKISAGRSYFYNTLRPLLNHAASLRASVQVHAGLSNWNEVGVLMPGGSGSGKSTLAVLAAANGHQLITDDLALITETNNREFAGRSLRRHFFLRTKTFELLPSQIQEHAVDIVYAGEPKHVLLREKLKFDCATTSAFKVIMFPRIDHNKNSTAFKITSIPKKDALIKLIQNTDALMLSMGHSASRNRTMKTLQKAVSNCHCLEIVTSKKLLENPERYVQEIVDQVTDVSKRP